MNYLPAEQRYDSMQYRRSGSSGLLLPAISLGFWHNFGNIDDYQNCRSIVHTAFDHGITHFDLANNYGPPPGGAEETFGRIYQQDLKAYRDEILVSTKAGYRMWPGPYGDGGSKKYLVASLEASLQRMQLEYVDIFYHHRPDPLTPFEETALALQQIVQQGKALYIGLSSYSPEQTRVAVTRLRELNVPVVIHQPKYSLLHRHIEGGLLDVLGEMEIGCICFSSLAQGLLTNKYLHGIPADSRAASHRGNGALEEGSITEALLEKIKALHQLAEKRGQSLAQMALAWVLKDERITSVIIGASRPGQVKDSIQCLNSASFSREELGMIDTILR